jgi:hypothetical protein
VNGERDGRPLLSSVTDRFISLAGQYQIESSVGVGCGDTEKCGELSYPTILLSCYDVVLSMARFPSVTRCLSFWCLKMPVRSGDIPPS